MPDCNRKFPRDVGKERPCLNCHMGICDGWCRGTPGQEIYRERIEQAMEVLTGGAKRMIADLETQMLAAAEAMQFERAAELRDRMRAVKELANRQSVINAACADTDAIGFRRGARTAFVVMHYADGDLAGKDTELMAEPVEEDAAALSTLVQQYYARRGGCPRQILLPMELEDAEPLAQLLTQMSGHRVELTAPQRGTKRELVQAAVRNAQEEGLRAESEAERRSKTLQWLQKMLGLDGDLHRIEAFDISNTGDFGIVASMVVFEDGKPAKSKYRRFRMKEVTTQDDFASMHEAVSRRMAHFNAGDD